MREPLRTHSARACKACRAQAPKAGPCSGSGALLLRLALCVGLACLLPLFPLAAGTAAEAIRPGMGESYIDAPVAEGRPAAPGQALEHSLLQASQNVAGLLDPSSGVWAGAQGLDLSLQRPAVLLSTNVIASAGDATAAAASHADGRIELFGAGNCTSLAMPSGDPAYAMALAAEGNVLAAWAQGLNRLVFFDLRAPGCPATTTETAMRGQISLTVSATGGFLAAQDQSGQVWVGPRGGAMRMVAALGGTPAAIGFSDGEGVLLVLDGQGHGGAWNARSGVGLRTLRVPGGPFARGDIQGIEARLWTTDGRLVRWDVLHNRTAEAEKTPGEASTGKNDGWLELRGPNLLYVRSGLSWRPAPVYEPHLPQLAVSSHARCLRLSDVDGVVRYFDAHSGKAHSQCFADDWTEVVVKTDGTAHIPGLRMRIFDQLEKADGTGKINVRALSDTQVMLWTAAAPGLTLSVEAPAATPGMPLGSVAEPAPSTAMVTKSVPLRQGLAADAPTRPILLQ